MNSATTSCIGLAYPNGIRCGDQDVVRWDSEYGQIEHQANVVLRHTADAAGRFPSPDRRRRRRLISTCCPNCADRYRVSLIAALLRWLEYTERRAVLVVSRDGFILWARSSKAALRTGAFFSTSAGPIEVPATSLVARQDRLIDGRAGLDLPAGTWLREPVREMTIFADQYDFALSLLMLSDDAPHFRNEKSTSRTSSSACWVSKDHIDYRSAFRSRPECPTGHLLGGR